MDIQDVLKSPIVTEKSTGLREKNVYTFEVDKRASKIDISRAVTKIFGVEVVDCSVLRTKPKRKWLRSKRGFGTSSTYKKAMVRIKAGQSISDLEV